MSCWIILFLLFCNKRCGCRSQEYVDTAEDCGCHSHGFVDTAEECGCNTNSNYAQNGTGNWSDCERDNGRESDSNLNRSCDCDNDRRYDERDYRRDRDWGYDREWNRDRDNDCDCDRASYRNKN